MNDWEKNKVQLNYGYQECEDGIYHAFTLEDSERIGDPEETAKVLAELLDTTPDDDRFGWNSMFLELPRKTIERFRERGRQELLAKVTLTSQPETPSCFYVRKIGSDAIDTVEVGSWEEGLQLLKDYYKKILDEKGEPCAGYDMEFDEKDGSFLYTDEEYYQTAFIIRSNDFTGARHTIEQIRRLASEVDTFANCYEYELQNMDGVYGTTEKIRDLADMLEREISVRAQAGVEKTYVDLLNELKTTLGADTRMPAEEKSKATYFMDKLAQVLSPYSE